MIRSKLWFRCAAMKDPVTPVVLQPSVLGWEAKERNVELTIERTFNGDELIQRMKGWVTVDVKDAVAVINGYGIVKVLDERDLVVETETEEAFEKLEKALSAHFGDQLTLERT